MTCQVGEYKRCKPYQRLNHYPKASCIARKDVMLRGIRKSKGQYGRVYDIVPEGYIIPSEYVQFCEAYSKVKTVARGGSVAGV